jgi:hypothetical protein
MDIIQQRAPADQAHSPVIDGDDDFDTGAATEPAGGGGPLYGWTPRNQAMFLSLAAEGETVEHAASCCGLTAASVYALRKRDAGKIFALGWDAARILARERLADLAFTRSVEGWEEVVTRTRARDDDGETVTTTRRRVDNGLLSRQLARLDAQCAGLAADDAARIVAREFDAFLALVRLGASPARVGLFLTAHGLGTLPPGLEPLVALARADTMLRTGAGLAADIDVADLDPAARADWTAEQWRRAEAAGLVALAPSLPEPAGKETAFEGQIPQTECRIWQDTEIDDWVTDLPPPADYDGFERGEYGEDSYYRDLSEAEHAVIDAEDEVEIAQRRASDTALRDAMFGFPGGAPDDDDGEEEAEEPADPPGSAGDKVGIIPIPVRAEPVGPKAAVGQPPSFYSPPAEEGQPFDELRENDEEDRENT